MNQDSFAADRSLIRTLERRSKPISCVEGCVLFNQGEPVSGLDILQSGEAVLIMKSAAGNVVMCLKAGADSVLGLPGVVGDQPYSMTAIARKGSVVRVVARDDFEDMIRAEPSPYPMVLQILAAEVRAARQALSEA